MRSALAYLLLLCLSFLKGADPVVLTQQNTGGITGISSNQNKSLAGSDSHRPPVDALKSSYLCDDDDDEFEGTRKKTSFPFYKSTCIVSFPPNCFSTPLKTVLTKQFDYSPPDKTIFKRSLLV